MNETTPPNDERAEKSVLSSILQKPDIYVQRAKSEGLIPSMLYNAAHRSLLEAILGLFEEDKPIESITLSKRLTDAKKLEAIGGVMAISDITWFAPTHAHFGEHLDIIKETCALRKGQLLSNQAKNMIEEGTTWSEVVAVLEAGVDDIKSVAAVRKCFVDAIEARDKFFAVMNNRMDSGETAGMPTGVRSLDLIGGGMRDGEFWVICGETSAGKSALSYQMAIPAIDAGKKVLIYTLEMGDDEVFSRLISCRGRVDLGSIMNPRGISKGDGMAIKQQAGILAGSKLLICDEANMTIDFICAQSEMEAESESVALIIVDYVQLIDGGGRRGESREQELSRISKRLKQLAKKIGCPVISPAQLNDDGKLRESRAIGQDADVVLKIKEKGIAVDKFRNAERDQFLKLELVGKYQRFEEV